MAEEKEYVEFLLYENRYMAQYGAKVPRYIWASPDKPVRVKLPAKIKKYNKDGSYELIDYPEGPRLKRAPIRPIVDVRPNVNYSDTAPANVAQEAGPVVLSPMEASDETEEPVPGLRAADV